MRLGTSRGLFRRAKLRRVRRTEAEAKMRLLRGRDGQARARGAQTTKDSTAKLCPREGCQRSRTPSPGSRVCGASPTFEDGYGYQLAAAVYRTLPLFVGRRATPDIDVRRSLDIDDCARNR